MNFYPFFKMKYLLVLACLVLLIPAKLISQEALKINLISGQVNFDGKPDEDVWKEATVFPLIVHSPNFGAEPSERSEVMIAYNQEYLWIGARLFSEDPGNITSTSKKETSNPGIRTNSGSSWIPMTTMRMPWPSSPCLPEPGLTIPFPMTQKAVAGVAWAPSTGAGIPSGMWKLQETNMDGMWKCGSLFQVCAFKR